MSMITITRNLNGGTFRILLLCIAALLCMSATTLPVMAAEDPPVAGFTATPVTGIAPLTVQFTDVSSGTITAYAWDFNDDGIVDDTTQNPGYIYTTAGRYSVSLTVTGPGGSDTVTRTSYITPVSVRPTANFTAIPPLTGSTPLTVQFTDLSTNYPTSWSWRYIYKPFGGNWGTATEFSTEQNPAYTFTQTGWYQIRLYATNAKGSTNKNLGSSTVPYIIVNEVPVDTPDLIVLNIGAGGAAVPFARETNTIVVTVKNVNYNNVLSPATTVTLAASDGYSAVADVPAISAGEYTTISFTDPTIRDIAGPVTYTAAVDPLNTVSESDETNNAFSRTFSVDYNGYKGVQYWDGKEDISTYLTYDIRGDIVHSFGNSRYSSGKGADWTSLTWDWTADDLPVPAGATVKTVRLYIPYCWDYENEVGLGTTTTSFNGVTLTPVHAEQDYSNFGAYALYRYGLVTYDVTDLYLKNAFNTATFTRSIPGGSLSTAGFTLMVVYEDPSETRKQIFVNEGWDLLGASVNDYSTTEEEATSYQEFTGMTIDMAGAGGAELTTFVPWGAPQDPAYDGEGNLFVNGVQIGSNVWNYGERTVGESDSPQVAVDVRDIRSYLNSGGTGNTIAIQSTAGASPCMVAERSFLVVEYPDDTPVPEFPIMAFPVLVIGALAAIAVAYRRM